MKKNKFIIFGVLLLLLSGLFLVDKLVQAEEGSDAIAVRIMPNSDHYNINEWYREQGFVGSPQALIVDGYEAIRDGRTVYVNAANLKGNLIYTNVYLISYNQDSSNKTIDILGQIIKKWKFNTDLENTGAVSTCSISSSACLSAADCADNQTCATSGLASSSCQLKLAKNCLLDSDCPGDFFCDSVKAKIIRDLNRISIAKELNSALNYYKNLNGAYPKLEAGTYLSQNTVSVWPSWSESFLPVLGLKNLKDPINRLGACPGYDVTTCWNADIKKFVFDSQFDSQIDSLMLPAGSYGFIYRTDANGSNYKLCSVMETKKLGYQFSPNNLANSICVEAGAISGGEFTNTAPRIADLYLTGEADKEFNGSIKVIDDENNPLTWQFDTTGQNWTGWSAAPILKNTNNTNLKKIYALQAGGPGTYITNLIISDGQEGGILNTTTPIVIINSKPFIEAEDVEFEPSTQNSDFDYSFYITDNNLNPNLNDFYSIKPVPNTGSNFFSGNGSRSIAGENRYKISYLIPISAIGSIPIGNNYTFQITAKDKYDATSTKNFKVKMKTEAPTLAFSCPSDQRIFSSYSCLLGATSQNGHSLKYEGRSLPSDLKINTVLPSVYLSGVPSAPFNDEVTIITTNEYNESVTKSFNLKINNYCGDGVRQQPNTEGAGGVDNNGYEDCDGNDGVAQNVAASRVDMQYGCQTSPGAITPFPILDNSYCVYKSLIDGGGYCGDGFCQVKVETPDGIIAENDVNCPADCVSACVPQCNGKTCGDDGCGGSCEPNNCSDGTLCTNGSCCPTSANIQISVDNYHTTYFNEKKIVTTEKDTTCGSACSPACGSICGPVNSISAGCCWAAIQKFDVTVKPGINVLAVKAVDVGADYGLAATLNQAPCSSMTTSDISNWKCTKTAQSGDDWTKINFDDSTWEAAISTNSTNGNALASLGVKQIWAKNAFGDSTIYCRYTFESSTNVTNDVTEDDEKPDKTDCEGDSNCDSGYYCHLNPSNYYNCNSSAETGTCQKKCWSMTETNRNSVFFEGATLFGCSAYLPPLTYCNANPTCPSDCQSGSGRNPIKLGISSGSTVSCGEECIASNANGCLKWRGKTSSQYLCYNNTSITRYFEDDCRAVAGYTSLNGIMSAEGKCEKMCTPNCLGQDTGKFDGCGSTCGSKASASGECIPFCQTGSDSCGDNGCGGTCGCASDKICNYGTCELACTPNCSGKKCGDDDGCSDICTACPENTACDANSKKCICTADEYCQSGYYCHLKYSLFYLCHWRAEIGSCQKKCL